MKRGFTLVELLAVIVILAIILAIALPSISSTIKNATRASFESDARMVLKALGYKMLEDDNFDFKTINEANIESLLKISASNYKSVTVKESNGKPYIIIVGQNKWNNLVAAGNSNNMVVHEGLVLWLDGEDFINSPQSPTWIDRSGNGNNAVPNNFSYTASSGNDGAGSIAFDGINDNMKVLHNNSLIPKNITISILVNANNWSAATANNLIIKRSSVNSYFLFADSGSGNVSFDWSNARWTTGYNLPINEWVLLSVTRDNNNRKLYINGNFISETTNVGPDSAGTSDLYIGADGYNNCYYYNGKIRSIAIYNRTLTSDEIKNNYLADKDRFGL